MLSSLKVQRSFVVVRLVLVVLGHYSDCLIRLSQRFLTSFSAIYFPWVTINSSLDTKLVTLRLLFSLRYEISPYGNRLFFVSFVINIPNIQVFRNVLTIERAPRSYFSPRYTLTQKSWNVLIIYERKRKNTPFFVYRHKQFLWNNVPTDERKKPQWKWTVINFKLKPKNMRYNCWVREQLVAAVSDANVRLNEIRFRESFGRRVRLHIPFARYHLKCCVYRVCVKTTTLLWMCVRIDLSRSTPFGRTATYTPCVYSRQRSFTNAHCLVVLHARRSPISTKSKQQQPQQRQNKNSKTFLFFVRKILP